MAALTPTTNRETIFACARVHHRRVLRLAKRATHLENSWKTPENSLGSIDGEHCRELITEIQYGIEDYAIVHHPEYGDIYAYETDGFGNYCLMDDANSPSLMAMPYLKYCDRDDPIYQNTRKFILSKENPYYHEGTYAKGIGSPHTPAGTVWHIGIIMQALTSDNRDEILDCLEMLSKTHAGTNYMHESFDPNCPETYTRPWFAWANTLFAQLLDELRIKGFFER